MLLIRLGEFEVDQELRGLELSLFMCLRVLLTTIDSFCVNRNYNQKTIPEALDQCPLSVKVFTLRKSVMNVNSVESLLADQRN